MGITVTVARTAADSRIVERDVRLTAPEGTVLGAVRAELAAAVDAAPTESIWAEGELLTDSTALGGTAIRDGARLWVGAPPFRELASVLELHAVGGPLAGQVFALTPGVTQIGRAPASGISLTDADISRQHALLDVRIGQVFLQDCGSTNGTRVNGTLLGRDPVVLTAGDVIELGETVLTLSAGHHAAAAVRYDSAGRRRVNRAPRLAAPPAPAVLDLPAEADAFGPAAVQWLAALVPALAGGAFAMFVHNPEFLAFALLSPLVVLTQAASDRLTGRRRRQRHARQRALAERHARHAAADLMVGEAAQLRYCHPDPVQAERTARLPGTRLWERDADDPDALRIRLGLGNVASQVSLRRGPQIESAGLLPMVPITVDLSCGPLGVIGPAPATHAIVRWAICQLAIALAPSQLRLVPLIDDAQDVPDDVAQPDWHFTRWLPHVIRANSTANDPADGIGDLLDTLLTELTRTPDRRALPPWTVLILDERSAAGSQVGRLLEMGAAARVTAIAVGSSPSAVPSSCVTLGQLRGETPTRLDVRPVGRAADTAGSVVLADQVHADWCDRVARALASTDDAGSAADGALPVTARLLDVLDLNDPTPAQLIARWAQQGPPTVALAVSARGPLLLDLAGDGPHALVAGTTGAGKSELLQSLIAGLAATQSPSALNFVLIDYKGGAAFADCAGLPHTVALATDLDAHLTRRALVSFEAELRRREAVLARAGVPSIDALGARGRQPELARLVIVVDEFAALAQELPDFIPGLVSIAQRGRSLGLHLVLATQRPGGVVSPEIRANTALRIGLRMTDPGESLDVVGTDAASRISKSTPGRAVIRTGSSVTEVQTARISGTTPIAADDIAVELVDSRRQVRRPLADEDGKTDLQLLVAAAREAATRLACPPPVSPWLPILPTSLPMTADEAGRVRMGVVDLPAEQRQDDLVLRVDDGIAALLVGGPSSGKSTALRALAMAIAWAVTPDDVHVYVLDFAGALRGLDELPHCGCVLGSDDMTSVASALEYLTELAGRRQASDRAVEGSRPAILLLIDGWDGFAAASEEHDGGHCVDLVLELLRDGRASAITVVLSGDRGTPTGRLTRLIERKILLRLADSSEYAVAGIPPKAVPQRLPPGRGLLWGSGCEVQLGIAGQDPSDAAQRRAVADAASRWPAPGRAPKRFRPLPRHVTVRELRGASRHPGGALLGVGGPDAVPVAIDLDAPGIRVLVAGTPRSGRSTVLVTLLGQIPEQRPCAVVASHRSPLRDTARQCGASVLAPDLTPVDGQCQPGTVLIVDDGETLTDTALGDWLTDRLRQDPDRLSVILAARSEDLAVTYRGPLFAMRRTGRVILLDPGPGDADLVGVRLPRRRSPLPPGRGYAALGDLLVAGPAQDTFTVQVALP